MASELSNYLANEILGWVAGEAMPTAPTTVYVALFSADPTAAGTLTNEVTTTIRAGGRVAIDWTTITAREITNELAVDFGSAAGGASVTHFGLFDAATVGNMLAWSALDTPRTIVAADPVVFPVGDLAFNFN